MTDYFDPGMGLGQDLGDDGSYTDDDEGGVYGKTWEFDFTTGDYVTDGSGHVQTVTGPAALLQAVRKQLSTRRYTYLGYGRDYGNDLAATLADPPPGADQDWVVFQSTQELLAADPRIQDASEVAASVNTLAQTGVLTGTIIDRYGAPVAVGALPFRFDI